jgi:hypothetical protein
MSDLSTETREALAGAGWFPGRRVDTTQWRARFSETGIQMHAAAETFLAEFGGLAVGHGGPGISRAREPFELDPMLAWGEEDRFLDWSETIGRNVFPVGELDHGRFFLGLDEHAELYSVETWVASFGSMPIALDNLVLGVMPETVADS